MLAMLAPPYGVAGPSELYVGPVARKQAHECCSSSSCSARGEATRSFRHCEVCRFDMTRGRRVNDVHRISDKLLASDNLHQSATQYTQDSRVTHQRCAPRRRPCLLEDTTCNMRQSQGHTAGCRQNSATVQIRLLKFSAVVSGRCSSAQIHTAWWRAQRGGLEGIWRAVLAFHVGIRRRVHNCAGTLLGCLPNDGSHIRLHMSPRAA